MHNEVSDGLGKADETKEINKALISGYSMMVYSLSLMPVASNLKSSEGQPVHSELLFN